MKIPLLKIMQRVMINWLTWLCWGVACPSLSFIELCLPSPYVILLPYIACKLPLRFIWFDLIEGDKWNFGVSFLNVIDLPVRIWAWWLFIIYSLIFSFMCHSFMIASLEFGFLLFEITFDICICSYDWGTLCFI